MSNMAQSLPQTFHAPPERASPSEIQAQRARIPAQHAIREALDSSPNIILILNQQRQVVYASRSLYQLIGDTGENQVYGSRPGELLDCEHAIAMEAGCGTSEFCRTCGAVNSILAAQKGRNETAECRLTRRNGDSLDLRVWSTPFELDNEQFILFSITDISNEKRRQALERIFFHDILNTATGLLGVSELVERSTPDKIGELVPLLSNLTNTLIDEINAQKMLSAAESGELIPYLEMVDTGALLSQVAGQYCLDAGESERTVVVDAGCSNLELHTDRVILKRVLGNMVKNALEATRPGQTVTLGCQSQGELVELWVHNPGAIRREIQLQIFQRSFSTKGRGRGLGTYSIKLLTERYLNGKVAFTTSPEAGTRFYIQIPASTEDATLPSG